MNVKRIDGGLLNFWVAKSAGLKLLAIPPVPGEAHDPESGYWHPSNFHPARNWSHGGPIVSNDWYALEDKLLEWFGPQWAAVQAVLEDPLKWFMRAYVATQFGEVVEDVSFAHDTGAAALMAETPHGLGATAAAGPMHWWGLGRK